MTIVSEYCAKKWHRIRKALLTYAAALFLSVDVFNGNVAGELLIIRLVVTARAVQPRLQPAAGRFDVFVFFSLLCNTYRVIIWVRTKFVRAKFEILKKR